MLNLFICSCMASFLPIMGMHVILALQCMLCSLCFLVNKETNLATKWVLNRF